MSNKTITVVKTELTIDSRLRCIWIVMLDYTLGMLNAILAGINLSRGAYLVAFGDIAIAITIGVFAALSIKNAYWANHKTYIYDEPITTESKETA